jgi:hypothetical protein
MKRAANFPGFIISNTITAFLIVLMFSTFVLSFLLWPLFWVWIWNTKVIIVSILLPTFIVELMDGYFQDRVYSKFYVKHRCLAGFMDMLYFFLSIFAGITAAAK